LAENNFIEDSHQFLRERDLSDEIISCDAAFSGEIKRADCHKAKNMCVERLNPRYHSFS